MRKSFCTILFIILCFISKGQDIADRFLENPSLALKEAQVSYESGDYDKTIKLIKIYQSLSGKADGDDLISKAQLCLQYTENALLFEEDDDYSSAHQCYKKIIDINPRDPNAKRALDAEYAKKAFMDITQIKFANTDKNGNILTDFGGALYNDEVRYIMPKIYYNGLSIDSKTVELYFKIINPDRSLNAGTSSPPGYSRCETITISPGNTKTLTTLGWGNANGGSYTVGTHKFEIWYNGKQVYATTFEILEKTYSTGIHNGHEFIDLGLSVKWAVCNIGAKKPEDYGSLFAWGETTTKEEYTFEEYKFRKNNDYYNPRFTKYVTQSKSGTIDKKTTLSPQDDAARVNWGGRWRMPTQKEIEELVHKCKWKWVTQGGINGCRVTGPNGKSVFFPAAGYSGDNPPGVNWGIGDHGEYWSSSLNELTDENEWVYYLYFSNKEFTWHNGYRYHGASVRAVCE